MQQIPRKKHLSQRNLGFTLIELIVASGITALLLLTVTSMFATFLMSNVRTNLRRQLQNEGNSAMQQLEFQIRNASSARCSDDKLIINDGVEETTYFEYYDGNIDRIRIDYLSAQDQNLTSDQVNVTSFTCVHTDNPTVIDLKFTLSTLSTAENALSQEFSSKTLVRNTAF